MVSSAFTPAGLVRQGCGRLILEIDIRQLLPGAVDHDKAGVIEFFEGPRRREATSGYYPNSLIAAKCNAVGFFKPLFANSMIFSATNWVMASSRLLKPSASHVITKAFVTA